MIADMRKRHSSAGKEINRPYDPFSADSSQRADGLLWELSILFELSAVIIIQQLFTHVTHAWRVEIKSCLYINAWFYARECNMKINNYNKMLGIIISSYLFLKSSAILAVLLWLANILPTHSNCGVFGFQTVKQRTLNIPGYFCHKPEILHKSILMLFPLYPRQWNRKKVFWMKRKAPLVDSKNFPVCFFPKEASFVFEVS